MRISDWSSDVCSSDLLVDETVQMLATGPVAAARTAAVEAPRSLLELAATSVPSAIIQMLFMILVIYFFLAGWTRLRNQTISSRGSFDGAMTIARVIQHVVDRSEERRVGKGFVSKCKS